MIYTDLTKKAMQVAYNVHKEQVDKAGLPYIFHPYHLAEQMGDAISITVALLHDVVEDSDISFEDLEEEGIPKEVIDSLKILTHDSSVSYIDYVKAIKNSNNQVAIAVKIKDLKHNSDVTRIKPNEPSEKIEERLKRYKEAIDILEE